MKKLTIKLLLIISLLVSASQGYTEELERVEVRREGSHIIFKYGIEGDKNAKVRVTITMEGKTCQQRDITLAGDMARNGLNSGSESSWSFGQDFPAGCKAEVSVDIVRPPAGMIFVKGGCFIMGDTFGDGESDELPAHEVCLDDYYIDKYEVTQKDYRELTEENPTDFKPCDNCPADSITWYKAVEYCQQLGKRLPTEAQWEYAARSRGRQHKWPGTSTESEIVKFTRYMVNTKNRPQPVGSVAPNKLGVYDMGGNVWEWVNDWYGETYYAESDAKNPKGPAMGKYRILRGGAWNYEKAYVRNAHRNRLRPEKTDSGRGFRCALLP